jgi:hypothetical protein
MAISYRSAQALRQEIEYIRQYILEIFGQELSQESFNAQLTRIIDGKIEDYIFQRYRDWTAPELFNLMKRWDAEAPLPEAGHKPASGQRDSSEGILEPVIEEQKPRRGRPKTK